MPLSYGFPVIAVLAEEEGRKVSIPSAYFSSGEDWALWSVKMMSAGLRSMNLQKSCSKQPLGFQPLLFKWFSGYLDIEVGREGQWVLQHEEPPMHNAHFITKCALNTSQYKNSSQHTWRLCGSSGCGRLSWEAKMLFTGELLSDGNPWYMPSVTDWQAEAFLAAKNVCLPKQESNLIKSSYSSS